MTCTSIEASLPGFVGGDLRPAMAALVTRHLQTCSSCSEQAETYRRAEAALGVLAEREIPAPAGLADQILERVHEPGRRVFPVPPIPPEAIRILAENREAVASAAGAAAVAAGAAWVLWRAAKRRPGADPAVS